MGSANVKKIINYFKERVSFKTQNFKAGEYLFHEGIVADKAYIIREGECKIIKLKD